MGKGDVKYLDFGPESGQTRKEALMKVLEVVEVEIGDMMVRDRRDRRRDGVAGHR
jgi:hypothetical protein